MPGELTWFHFTSTAQFKRYGKQLPAQPASVRAGPPIHNFIPDICSRFEVRSGLLARLDSVRFDKPVQPSPVE